ncbi:MAG: hypothetical protein U5K74_01545 [Gemmatimonadaceae bacterium]|nr:hypothetical protein [Gemmatimonadaceae bacterium]
MKKLLMMSILFATFIIPMRAARTKSPMRGLRRSVLGIAAWIFIYVIILSVYQFEP